MMVGTLFFGAKRSNQWTQCVVCSGIVVYGGGDIVLWCKKVKPVNAVCSGIVVYDGRDIVLWCKKVKPVDAVCGMQWNSGIWWWGHCSLVQKRSNQWMQYAVCSGHSRIVVYGGWEIVLWCKKVKPV